MKTISTLCLTVCLASTNACSKKDDKESTVNATDAAMTEQLKNPVGVLNIALDTLGSVGSGLSSSLTAGGLRTTGDDSFTEADCDEHAEALARSGDDSMYKDNTNRLRISHVRAPLQNFYCKMQKDTGSEDSFLGTVSSSKMILCLVTGRVEFDGVAQEVTLTRDEVAACIPGTPTEDDINEMAGPVGTVHQATITSSLPAETGAADAWDASVKIELANGPGVTFLMRNSGDVLAAAQLGGGQPDDGWYVSINKSTGEVNYESKAQRLSSTEDSNSVGWSRHVRAYVKGTLNDDLKFEGVSALNGIYSNISREAGGNRTEGLQSGDYWTVTGNADGVKSVSYRLDCTYDANTTTTTCPDANVVANWVSYDNEACNGSATDTACGSAAPLKAAADADTQFFLSPENSAFVSAKTWLTDLPIADFSTITFKISQY